MADKQAAESQGLTPGVTIHPGDAPATTAATAPMAAELPSLTDTPEPSAAPAVPPTPEPSQTEPEVETSAYVEDAMTPVTDDAQISWTASEFIDHAKSIDWYLALAVVAVLAAVVVYLLFRDLITAIVIIVAALAFGMYGRRRPRLLEYKLDTRGLFIADKFFPYGTFRSFAVVDEGHFSSIAFLPLKRFGLLTTVYYDPADEETIINTISQHLPIEPRNADIIDRFMKRIRF